MLVPALEGQDIVNFIDVEDVEELAAEPAAVPLCVQPELNQVAIETHNTLVLLVEIPVERNIVPEPLALQKFLTLKKHGDAGGSKDQPGCQCGSLLRMPAGRIAR